MIEPTKDTFLEGFEDDDTEGIDEEAKEDDPCAGIQHEEKPGEGGSGGHVTKSNGGNGDEGEEDGFDVGPALEEGEHGSTKGEPEGDADGQADEDTLSMGHTTPSPAKVMGEIHVQGEKGGEKEGEGDVDDVIHHLRVAELQGATVTEQKGDGGEDTMKQEGDDGHDGGSVDMTFLESLK